MMEPFAILGMSMIVFGLIMLVGSFGLLMYGLWLRYWVEPSRSRSSPASAPDSRVEAEQP